MLFQVNQNTSRWGSLCIYLNLHRSIAPHDITHTRILQCCSRMSQQHKAYISLDLLLSRFRQNKSSTTSFRWYSRTSPERKGCRLLDLHSTGIRGDTDCTYMLHTHLRTSPESKVCILIDPGTTRRFQGHKLSKIMIPSCLCMFQGGNVCILLYPFSSSVPQNIMD